jgi:hypothetical protein
MKLLAGRAAVPAADQGRLLIAASFIISSTKAHRLESQIL